MTRTITAADEPERPVRITPGEQVARRLEARCDQTVGVCHACSHAADALRELAALTPQWAATVKPGDTLVLGFTSFPQPEMAEEAYEWFDKALPGVKVMFVDGVTSMVVQPAPAGEATK